MCTFALNCPMGSENISGLFTINEKYGTKISTTPCMRIYSRKNANFNNKNENVGNTTPIFYETNVEG